MRLGRIPPTWRACLLGPFVFCLTAGCGVAAERAVDLTLDVDPCVADQTERWEVAVFDGEQNLVERFVEPSVSFPSGIRILARDEQSNTFSVEATWYGVGNVPIAFVRYPGEFPSADGPALLADRVLVDQQCLGQICDSGACINGICQPAGQLADRDPGPAPETCPGHAFVRQGSTGDCSGPERPCATIGEAIDLLPNGGIVEVHGEGLYGPVRVENGNLTLRAWPGTGQPTIDANGQTTGILVRGQRVTLHGLEITNASINGVLVNNMSRFVSIRHCEIHGCGFDPMSPRDNKAAININQSAADVVVEDNLLRDNVFRPGMPPNENDRNAGVFVNLSTRVTIRRNQILRNAKHGVLVTMSNEIVTANNVIDENGGAAVLFSSSGAFASNNRICRSRGDAIVVRGNLAVQIIQNTVVDSTEDGIVTEDQAEKRVEQNIIAFNGGVGLRVGVQADLAHGRNLYFENQGGDQIGNEFAGVDDVFADPRLEGREDCSLVVSAESPAQGQNVSDNIGAR